MSDFFPASEPMDIEGEAVCAVGPQLVTAEGEPGAGVDVKRSFSNLGAPLLDVGEGISDLLWVRVSRAHGGAKGTWSMNAGPRPMKQRR